MMPVIIPDHVTHSDVRIEDAEIHSAGFFLLGTDELVTISPDGSNSLGIGPKPGDRELIIAVLTNCGMYAYLKI